MEGDDAKAIIARQFTGKIEIGSCYSAYLCQYKTDRVRVGVDEEGKVKYPPTIG